ncbi:MAG: sn-glycerol-3-phosphate transporter [Pseudomonadota bacterium]
MKHHLTLLKLAGAIVVSLAAMSPVHAQVSGADQAKPDHYPFYFQTSVASAHFRSDPKHVNKQELLNLEWDKSGNYLLGAALFKNSFGQSSQYLYVGKKFRPIASTQELYLKLTAGLVHGYKGEYRDKIPFNGSGIAPVILPSIGYCHKIVCSELVVFGNSGVMLTAGLRFK